MPNQQPDFFPPCALTKETTHGAQKGANACKFLSCSQHVNFKDKVFTFCTKYLTHRCQINNKIIGVNELYLRVIAIALTGV